MMTSLQDKEPPKEAPVAPEEQSKPPPTTEGPAANGNKGLDHSTQMTCDVLCSLSMSAAQGGAGCPDDEDGDGDNFCDGKMPCGGMGEGAKLCPKQMLPMFLSSTSMSRPKRRQSGGVESFESHSFLCTCSVQKRTT